MSVTGHAYPWDVLDDPGFAERVLSLGVSEVTLAAAYHSTRAATPLHPRHQVVEAPYAALYRPVRPEVWQGGRLAPRPASWLSEPDPFGTSADLLQRSGLRVCAWIVLTHNSRLGAGNPDVAVTNCYGDRYSYALCPARAEVRAYAATLAAEAVAGVPVDGVSLEACGQLGLAHNSHHEKTEGAWRPAAARLLSVCCCVACRATWVARGLDPAEVTDVLRSAVAAEAAGATGEVASDLAAELLAARHEATDLLRAEVLSGLRAVAPDVTVSLHAHPDPWTTGASPGLTPTAAGDVDEVLVPAWPTTPGSAEAVGAAARSGVRTAAYVTVLAPTEEAELPAHVRRLVAAGAAGVALYHLGLAPRSRLRLFAQLSTLLN
ncbi:MAG: hypothetical protein ACJ72N_26345 [Labedaea sp.]